MRLINCHTLELEEFFDSNIPNYAILSHTWGVEEVTFADLPLNQARAMNKAGYRKISFTCKQALLDGFHYAWVDTCCIDKSSSAELSEAINSMFNWYGKSKVCYVYLADVSKDTFEEDFPQSRWFKRGWTLQELIAPRRLLFYDMHWKSLGLREEHAELVSQITTIDLKVLLNGLGDFDSDDEDFSYDGDLVFLDSFSIAQRMSWASERTTTRVEDIAYSLLGMFGVNMPLLYGEGSRSFTRLQEEIIKVIDDDSILAWGFDENFKALPETNGVDFATRFQEQSILARSPSQFHNCGRLASLGSTITPFNMTSAGLYCQLPLVEVRVPVIPSNDLKAVFAGVLNCHCSSNPDMLIGILLLPKRKPNATTVQKLWRTSSIHDGIAFQTLCISMRDVARSIPEDVLIIRGAESGYSPFYHAFKVSIVVNISDRLKDIGYCVTNAEVWTPVRRPRNALQLRSVYINNLEESGEHWNSTTTTYTWQHWGPSLRSRECLLSFNITSTKPCPDAEFTVFAISPHRNACTRKGCTFSEGELTTVAETLGKQESGVEPEQLVLRDANNQPFEVALEFRDFQEVYAWRIAELNIDWNG